MGIRQELTNFPPNEDTHHGFSGCDGGALVFK
jgi:hypothetical protein